MVSESYLTVKLFRHYEDAKLESDKKRQRGCANLFFFVIVFPYTLRFLQSLIYQVKSLRAERNKDFERQRRYYNLMVLEESDVALIRIIERYGSA